ncbi:MAG TPA: hypothetical protein VJX29_13025 [Candidatus Acidoferrales bacterium]|nr:hypothetical protein [Candidatus Acidoferrales bacterium]
MSSLAISIITFACVFGGALLGIALRAVLPEHHLSADSKDVVKLGMGLVATMAALVLGLLIASAKASYDTQNTEVTEISAKVILLDRLLAHYGPESQEARALLHGIVAAAVDRIWSEGRTRTAHLEPQSSSAEDLYDKVQGLSPKNDAQQSLKAQALSILMGLVQTRWLMYEQGVTSFSTPLLVALILWLTFLFVSFGVLAPPNATAITSLFVSALSVSGAILMILEMYSPYAGLIQVSSAPLRAALAHLGQ